MENRFWEPKENWLEMLHYFVDMQNKTPQALIDQAQKVTEGVKMLKMFLTFDY
jgi:hypothetical protein